MIIFMENQQDSFGLTNEEVRGYEIKSFWGKIKYYLAKIEPAFVKILNTLIYWTLKFIKYFVTSVIRMILGKEV